MVKTHRHRILAWKQYGKKFITHFGISPDAWVQFGFQLAYYNLLGKFGAAYESCTVRRFFHGRTETIRSVSVESVEWVLAMCSPKTGVRLSLFFPLDFFLIERKIKNQNQNKNKNVGAGKARTVEESICSTLGIRETGFSERWM
jgi:hypothetical protein